MELTESLTTFFKITAATLKGASRRVFMARTVQELGRGGQAVAMREMGWSEWSIRKGLPELASGMVCVDAFYLRGRLPMDAKAPVKVGEFSRNGVNRVSTQALDHDFEPQAQVTPVGIFLPQHD